MGKSSSKMDNGVIVPVITPFNPIEIFPVIDHILHGGVSTIFLLGTTGEALKQTMSQKKNLIKNVANHIGKRAKFFVGITTPNMNDSLELMNLAYDVGATASFVAPRVLGPDCNAIIDTLLESGRGNLFLYNYPALSEGQFLPVDHILPFMSEERILGIKDSSGDLAYFDEIIKKRAEIKTHFKIFYGPENNLLEALKRDINGFVPGTGNLEPRLACEIWNKKEKGPWDEWKQTKEMIGQKSKENYIVGIKLILKDRGLISDANLY
jgi:dihydrodipicolinate synthase/N-acetylneuraminate lyase